MAVFNYHHTTLSNFWTTCSLGAVQHWFWHSLSLLLCQLLWAIKDHCLSWAVYIEPDVVIKHRRRKFVFFTFSWCVDNEYDRVQSDLYYKSIMRSWPQRARIRQHWWPLCRKYCTRPGEIRSTWRQWLLDLLLLWRDVDPPPDAANQNTLIAEPSMAYDCRQTASMRATLD